MISDVAIGSPYEGNGEGVVYIYRGSKNGLVTTPMQVKWNFDCGPSKTTSIIRSGIDKFK